MIVLLKLAKQGRVRVILDNAALHKSTDKKTAPEDAFEKLFDKVDKDSILRGHFGRYAHDKVLIVSDKAADAPKGARKVLTGSTNYSVTGLYVNSNHVILFDDPKVAQKYSEVFELAWNIDVKNAAFQKSPLANQTFSFSTNGVPATDISFSPHTKPVADKIMGALV